MKSSPRAAIAALGRNLTSTVPVTAPRVLKREYEFRDTVKANGMPAIPAGRSAPRASAYRSRCLRFGQSALLGKQAAASLEYRCQRSGVRGQKKSLTPDS